MHNEVVRCAAGMVAALASVLLISACSTLHPNDPLEPYNRAMFAFNDVLDKAALAPAAQAYSHLPGAVQTAIGNFFGNLGDVWTAANTLLQGKLADGVSDVMRVAVNTTLGLGGIIDIGSEAGLAKHKADFGQTLGTWGVASGHYLVLPLLGPSTVRDGLATPLDFMGNPWSYMRPASARLSGFGINLVSQRHQASGVLQLLDDVALDRYAFVRDGYMQRRNSIVHGDDVPRGAANDSAHAMPAPEGAQQPDGGAGTDAQAGTCVGPDCELQSRADLAAAAPGQGGDR